MTPPPARGTVFAAALALAALAELSRPAPAAAQGATRGNWLADAAAASASLQRRGITVGGFAQLDGSHVLAGGMPHALGVDLQRLIDLSLTLKTRRLLGWRGGTVFIDAQSHSGANVVEHQVPALADPDNMDAYAETSVDRAWVQQDLHGREIRVRAGLMYVDDQFFTVPYGGNFVSLDFSSDASISTFVLPTYPKGAWGADVFVHPNRHFSLSAGVFRDRESELPYDPGGALVVSEEAWHGRWGALPVTVQAGAWIDTGRFQRFTGGVTHSAAGAYLVASSALWRPAAAHGRGISGFLQFGAAPATVAAVCRHYGAGLVWTGPWASRPHDEFGLAYSDSRLSAAAGFPHRFEREIETYYQFDASHGWTVQPDLEYWQHPGGGLTPDTVLGLIRVMLTF